MTSPRRGHDIDVSVFHRRADRDAIVARPSPSGLGAVVGLA
jgi:hypothetical protein